MKKYLPIQLLIVSVTFLFWGCTGTIPLTTSLNDFVIMGIKTNKNDQISFKFSSKVKDTVYQLCTIENDKKSASGQYQGFNITPATVLNKMITEFMNNKFSKVSDSSNIKIEVNFDDFWIEYLSRSSGGEKFMAALGGGGLNYSCNAKTRGSITIKKDTLEFTKNIATSAEESYNTGSGNNFEQVYAKVINSTFNKFIAFMNAFLDENKF